MAHTITDELNVLKSPTASEEERNAALGKLMKLSWKIVIRRLPYWLPESEADDVANQGFFALYRQARKLPELNDRENFWKLLSFYTRRRALNVLRANSHRTFESEEALAAVAAPSVEDLNDLEASDVFARFLAFLNGLGENRHLADLARRRYLEEQTPEEIGREMGLTSANYRRLITDLNKKTKRFCEQFLVA